MPTRSKSSTTTELDLGRSRRQMPPIHPGEMLREEFLAPMGLSVNALSIAIRVPATRIGEIVHERRGISADTALRLGRYFHMSAEFWMNLQSAYDLQSARFAMDVKSIDSITPAPLDPETGALRVIAA